MKNIMRLLSGVILASTLLMSCNKDDDKEETRNFLKVGDTEYDLSAGILINFGVGYDNSWHYGYNNYITLYSEGLSLEPLENDFELLGKGHGIYFNMFSTAGNVLDIKDYTYCSTAPCPIGTFDDGRYIINLDSETDISEDENDIAGGKASVSKKDSEYSISFDCTSKKGKKITGFYKGTLRYFDWSGDKESLSLTTTKMKANLLKN